MTDYAVVVGIARYPGLAADGVAPDLDGPDNDAQAVRDWLVDPEGGALDPANVRLVRSKDFDPISPDDPQPAVRRIEQAMDWLERETARTPGGRLYLYLSGHGFSPRLEEGALFTAEATQLRPSYVYAHAWMRWFRQAQRFRESVLWMDCCMNYQQSIPTNEVLIRTQVGTGVPGPAFVALAAQTKNALEATMADGQVHGVFTWTLLKGLRGGAADERGRVTGDSLRTFLYNVMPEFLPDAVRRAGAVDLQPFVRADEGMVFRRLPTTPKYPVRLTFPPGAVGQRLRVWADRPYVDVVRETLTGTEWRGELDRGLYVAEAAGLRHGFQVSGAGDVDVAVTRKGPPVLDRQGTGRFALAVKTDNPAAAITVTDYAFERVFMDTGELNEQDKPGVYKVRVQIGRDIGLLSEEIVLLDRDLTLVRLTKQQLPSPAPIIGSADLHERHRDTFYTAARAAASAGPAEGRAMLSLISRYATGPDPRSTTRLPHPLSGLRLVDPAGAVVDHLTRTCRLDERNPGGPVAVWERELDPGPYFLRHLLPDGRSFEGCVVASPGWVTQLAIQRLAPDPADRPGAVRLGAIGDAAVFLRPPGYAARPSEQEAVIEAARLALAQGRNLFGAGRGGQLRDLLLQKYDDPIAGIIGCHLLLRAKAAGTTDAASDVVYDDAVRQLRDLLGADHPDVAALSLRCADPALRTGKPFTVPPMFSHSWQLIAEATYNGASLVPLALWQRVHATANLGPYFIWASDDATRAAHADQLSQWITRYAQPEAARDAAKQLNVPVAAARTLWRERSARG